MFRKIRKLYFKIYHLLKLLSCFLLFFFACNFVNAECEDYITSSATFSFNSRNGRNSLNLTTLGSALPEGTYTLYVTDGTSTFREYFTNTYSLSNYNIILFELYLFPTLVNCDLDSTYCTGSPDTGNRNYFSLQVQHPNGNLDLSTELTNHVSDFHLVAGTNSCIVPPTPPTPPESDSSIILTNYISLFLDRFSYLVEGFTTNSYLFIFISIIVVFAILNITFRLLHIRRGRY